ncbi:Metal-dependent carboxypeptidase [Magnetospirillum sp. LM-5]|uniref:carboxypeptidase M32 n=1 Tax=Magnetospirillum sp. LM-5 TaxID=2681466 RepID=UPI001381A7A4|nr:carboxypeptidase M32 [Magnetospirillum sp. LM-5]CAA7616775.1 Metal-dependent carboxypeptidase [Magnetospirillum sp. LM-5]
MSATPATDRLEAIFDKAATLGEALAVLSWDMSAMMPEGGARARAEQMALIKTIIHQTVTAPEVQDLLGAAGSEALDPWRAANLHEMHRDWVHAAAVPAQLVEALSKAESTCEMVWRDARPAADFQRVLPTLKPLLALVREAGQAKSEALGVGIYDALLDQYEPDGRSADIDLVFADLEAFLPDFIERALSVQGARPAALPLPGPFPTAAQKALGKTIMGVLGFDFGHGRLDESLHPFCGGIPDDVRLTTRYDEAQFTKSLMGVIHETGHALYEMGLPAAPWRRQPIGRARGMQMHESQSLLMEMQACRSAEFLTFAAPLLREAFQAEGPAWEPDNLARHFTRVERGFIRVDADEATYPAHVIIRYGLEKALIEGRMELEDLPEAWDAGYRRLLGITPPDDRLGCLQDIHWFGGAWGYFPTYTLGAMTAAQLFDAAKKAVPGIPAAIQRGDFAPLLLWLREHVHGKGSSLSTRDLLTQATGRPLDAGVFKAHLAARYLV